MFKTVNGGNNPVRGTKFSAAVDLFSNEDIIIGKGEIKAVKLGVALDFSDRVKSPLLHKFNDFKTNYAFKLFARSSLALKKGLIVANGTGVIDVDYEDEIGIILYNTGTEPQKIERGERIAQIMLVKHHTSRMAIESSVKRCGGFGSTGGLEKCRA